jgi:hypothetical protein
MSKVANLVPVESPSELIKLKTVFLREGCIVPGSATLNQMNPNKTPKMKMWLNESTGWVYIEQDGIKARLPQSMIQIVYPE